MQFELHVKRTGAEVADFLKNCLLYESMEDNFKKVFKRNYPTFLTVREGNSFTHYIEKETGEEMTSFILAETRKNREFMGKILEIAGQKYKELIKFCETLNKNESSLTNSQIAEILKEYFRLYKEPYPYFMITVYGGIFEREAEKKDSEEAKEITEIMIKLRYFGRENWNKAHELTRRLFAETARRLNLSIENLKFLKPAEIIGLLNKKNLNTNETIKQRQKCYFFHKNGKFELKENQTFKIEQEITPETNEITGRGTFHAKITGKARIINNKGDLEKVNQGDIIVLRMTTPDLVCEAMKKAAAIITDEGGITCHAAVVSREFNIPALIGTRFATKIFKDNDKIEVDTEKGIARKLI